MDSSEDKNIVCLTIHHTDNFKPEILSLKPVVCICVMDERTGTCFQKSNWIPNVVCSSEMIKAFITPLLTRPGLIFELGESILLSWEEDFILHEKYTSFTSSESNAMLFFLIGDMQADLSMRVIAWAFFRLAHSSRESNADQALRLQLYKPCQSLKNRGFTLADIYKMWKKSDRIPLGASFYISIKPYSPITVQPALHSMPVQLPIQEEKESSTFKELSASTKESSLHCTAKSKRPPHLCNESTGIVWTRKAAEMCEIPREKKLTLEGNKKCQIVKFSSNGRFLAAGCGSSGAHYLIFYEIPSGKLLNKVLAHCAPFQDIDWTFNDKFVLSASADSTVKIWCSKHWKHRKTFKHPSFVLSAKFQPTSVDLFASACFDHIIRICLLKTSQIIELESHVSLVCTLCWNGSGTKLYSADRIGQIQVWGKVPQEVPQALPNMYQLEREIKPKETKGISIDKMVINAFFMTTYDSETLCLFCRDSVIRVLTLNGELIISFESNATTTISSKGCCSPSGNLFFLCCDQGIYCFSYNDLCDTYDKECLFDPNNGANFCIDYHPYEHMLALSFWKKGVSLYVYERPGRVNNADVGEVQEICYTIDSSTVKSVVSKISEVPEICNRINSLTIENAMSEDNDNPKKKSNLEKKLPVEACADVTSGAAGNIHRPASYKTHYLDEPALSSSMDGYSSTKPKDYTKKIPTTEVTKMTEYESLNKRIAATFPKKSRN